MAAAQGTRAPVATLSKADGTVMVDKGKGYVTSKINTVLNEGDRVITLQDSHAEITFYDGCRSRLNANNLIVTKFNPGCKAAIISVKDALMTAPETVAHLSGTIVPWLVGSTLIVRSTAGNDNTPISGQ